eukprot:scaffold25988_cov63-Phaeocystis_antarctica.AAC.5
MPAACSWGRQVLYLVVVFEPAGKKSEFTPSQGPTVALDSPSHCSENALMYEPMTKSGLTLMSVVSLGRVPRPDLVVEVRRAGHLVFESHREHELGDALVQRHDPLRDPVQRVRDAAGRVRRLSVLDQGEVHRASEVRRMSRQHLGVEEADTRLEVHGAAAAAAGGHVEGRGDNVQGGGAVARAERRGAERDLDVVGALHIALLTEVGVVVQPRYLVKRGVEAGFNEDHHVGVQGNDVGDGDALEAARKVGEEVR